MSFKEPVGSPLAEPFWSAAREGRLVIECCSSCGKYIHYPSAVCDRCLSSSLEWREVGGAGTVESFSTVYRPFSAEFEDDVPYTVALVRLDEEVNLLTWLVEVAPEDVAIGMRVEVVFERVSADVALHRFRPSDLVPDLR